LQELNTAGKNEWMRNKIHLISERKRKFKKERKREKGKGKKEKGKRKREKGKEKRQGKKRVFANLLTEKSAEKVSR